MANYSKGITTYNNILHTARNLFYTQGYSNTTTRQIAKEANINLGLIKYHFSSKADIAYNIYMEIRNAQTDFLKQFDYSEIELYLMASAAELKLCFTNINFCKFYNEIYHEHNLIELLHSKASASMETNSNRSHSYQSLAAACISSIKPTIVNEYLIADNNHYSLETYIRFYTEQQAYYNNLPDAPVICDFVMQELDKYIFDVDELFFSINQKIR